MSAMIAILFVVTTICRIELNAERIFDVPVKESYDYVIVGGGTAGSVLAARLSEDPVSVLLLEAGRTELDNPLIDVPFWTPALQHSNQDWQYYTVPQTNSSLSLNKQQGYWPVGKVLGGSSCLQYMVHIRGSPNDYDEWAAEGCTGWSYKDVLPYFMKSEDVQIPELQDKEYHHVGGPMTVTVNPTTDTPLVRLYQEAAAENGWAVTDCNGANLTGFCETQSDIRAGTRCSTVKCYLRPVLNRDNLQVTTSSVVTKVLIENKRAVGVEFKKGDKVMSVKANKEVILSAGAVGSAQILMLSGVGPKEHLEHLKIDVEADLPVGNNLQDHLLMLMSYSTNVSWAVNTATLWDSEEAEKYILKQQGIFSGSGIDALLFAQTGNESKIRGSPDVEVHFFSVAPDEGMLTYGIDQNINIKILHQMVADASSNGIGFIPTYLHPKSRGTIRLKSKDPMEYPLIDPNYLYHPEDVDGLVRAARVVQSLASSEAMQGINTTLIPRDYPGLCDDVVFDSDAYWSCYVRHLASSCFHYSGTCRMGSIDDPTTVVDPTLRVKGISGLRVVDASVMRNIVSGNTHTPVVMIAEKAADLIRGN